MPVVRIRELDIDFPYEPYAAQVAYMSAVIEALERGEHALLESPTGTGKTLCMLCACMAWVLNQRSVTAAARIASAESPLGGMNAPELLSRRLSSTSKTSRSSKVMGGDANTPAVRPLRIVYTSRTHAQLAQVIRELRKTAYAGALKMSVLGSREHMCIHPAVSQQSTSQGMTSACSHARQDQRCRFFNRIQFLLSQPKRLEALSGADGCGGCVGKDDDGDEGAPTGRSSQVLLQPVHDIEELGKSGRSLGFCPYFYERATSREADVVFLPYNYLFDPEVRKQLPMSLDDSIVIMDEAHNLPSVLSSAANTSLTPLDLATAIDDVSRAVGMVQVEVKKGETDPEAELKMAMLEEELSVTKLALCSLEGVIGAVGAQRGRLPSNDDGSEGVQLPRMELPSFGGAADCEVVLKGSAIYDVLAAAALWKASWQAGAVPAGVTPPRTLSDALNDAIQLLARTDRGSVGLSKVFAFLNTIFNREESTSDMDVTCRTVFINNGSNASTHKQGQHHHHPQHQASQRWTLGFWCLDTSGTMSRAIAGVRSLLLTSGTLAPLDHFAAELGMPFGVTLQGAHVIEDHQVLCSVLCRGPSQHALNGSYAFRDGVAYREAIGYSLVNLCRNVPNGMLVFFPSYAVMNGALESWKMGKGGPDTDVTIWAQLASLKTLFVEPSDNQELNQVVQRYQKAAESSSGGGAVLFAVCRGKISEGVDFADSHGRCVVVIGIPYANQGDLFVRLKRQYLTMVAPHRPKVRGKCFTGDDWYRLEAMRSVNQAIGRVIRHKHDFGAVVLADERYTRERDVISSWLQRSLVVHQRFGEAYSSVTQFFQRHSRRHRAVAAPASAAASQSAGPASVLSAHVTATVPSTATDAAAFMEQQLTLSRQSELSKENPVSGALPKVDPVVVRRPMVRFSMQPVEFLAQATPPPPPPSAGTNEPNIEFPPDGTAWTSKAYCDVLRLMLSPPGYQTFRSVLGDLSVAIKGGGASASSSLQPLLGRLATLYAAEIKDHSKREKLLQGFSCFLPQSHRALCEQMLTLKTQEPPAKRLRVEAAPQSSTDVA